MSQTNPSISVPLISVQDLRVSFRVGKSAITEAVKGVSFDVPANSTVALVGESGSGKSVTAMSIVRLLPENAIVAPESKVLYYGMDSGTGRSANNGIDLLRAPIETLRQLRGKDMKAGIIGQE